MENTGVKEVRKNREELWKENNYNLEKLFLKNKKTIEKLKNKGLIVANKKLIKIKNIMTLKTLTFLFTLICLLLGSKNFVFSDEFDDTIKKSIKDVKPTNHFYNKFLPAGAVVVETKNIKTKYGERVIILWMKKPEKNNLPGGEITSCPDYTTGISYYSGQTFVSLLNKKDNKVINTISLGEMDISQRNRKDLWESYHKSKNISKSEKIIDTKHLSLIDFNGDGYSYEFAFFSQENCALTNTMLAGYSVKQDKIIKYAVKIKYIDNGKTKVNIDYWVDSLFMYRYKFKNTGEKKKILIDYTGRCGCLEEFTYTYSPKYEMFFGKLKLLNCAKC